ncbi:MULTISPECIES: phosphopantetheine-binding protein [Bacilli]|jgi:acyl carrier protein|uniref:Carrier domain-containing protein n=1 Tax=Listeria aquatica FSL S10-1188 TaxID=1265818 RepID=W7BJL9_9LIST|nr:phosphopantetheine-binding protein [Listeria aquatica]EUJ19983.1 hypothetical protein MAQA_04371 [Listeria aquatica FSL S10-1188]
MNKEEIIEFITDELLDFGIEPEELKKDADLINDLGLDSTETVDLSLSIKKKYNVLIEFGGRDSFNLYDLVTEIYSNVK